MTSNIFLIKLCFILIKKCTLTIVSSSYNIKKQKKERQKNNETILTSKLERFFSNRLTHAELFIYPAVKQFSHVVCVCLNIRSQTHLCSTTQEDADTMVSAYLSDQSRVNHVCDSSLQISGLHSR